MPFSVALNQPRFTPDDDGGLGQWAEIATGIASSLISVGGSFLTAKINTDAITKQIATQTQAAKDLSAYQAQQQIQVAQVSAATPITSSPLFLPVIGGVAVLLFVMYKGGKR
jgi:hypothetical protein